jgi:uncharacterized cupin superfamily protein
MDRYIVKKSEIEEMECLSKSHYLNSNAVRINKSIGDLTGLEGFGFHIIEVPPTKESTEFHSHKFEDECVYVLSGNATARIGTEEFEISGGDFLGYRANGLAHTILNTGSEMLRCIVVGERLDHDVADYPKLNKRLYRNKGESWDLVDINNVEHPSVEGKS